MVAAGAVVVAGTDPALARIAMNTIEGSAVLGGQGRIAEGVALVGCTEGQRVAITLTFTQGPVTGQGHALGDCVGEGELARYPVRVTARGRADFQPGAAQACAVAVNTDRGRVLETLRWCSPGGVELVED